MLATVIRYVMELYTSLVGYAQIFGLEVKLSVTCFLLYIHSVDYDT